MLELGAGFHPDFTGRENVYMNGSIHGLSEREVDDRLDEIVAFSELPDFIDMPVRTYSSGMSMRLAFAIASHVNPDVLLLDEVLAVGDEAFQRKCFGRIFDFRRGGGTLVFVSHDPGAVERVCDRAVLLVDGDGSWPTAPPPDVLATYHRRSWRPTARAPAPSGRDADAASGATAEVVIRGARLVGRRRPDDRFVSGEPFTIEMDVEASAPVQTPIFGIAVHTVDGTPVYGTNTRLDSLADRARSRPGARVRFTIAALPLHEGRFTVSVAVVVAGRERGLPLARPLARVQRLPERHRHRAGEHGGRVDIADEAGSRLDAPRSDDGLDVAAGALVRRVALPRRK